LLQVVRLEVLNKVTEVAIGTGNHWSSALVVQKSGQAESEWYS